MLEFLYLGRCPDLHNVNCIDVIELANRLCQPQFVALIEDTVLRDLTEAVQNCEEVTDDVLALLEASQVCKLKSRFDNRRESLLLFKLFI